MIGDIAVNTRLWILAAMVLGLAFGNIFGEYDNTVLIISLAAMMSFSLDRLTVRKGDFARNRRNILILIVLSCIVSTVMTLAAGLFFDDTMWKGWVILACVPCAISVVSGTIVMKGDVNTATAGTVCNYLISIASAPILSFLLIGDAIDPTEILKYILLFIAIPFAVSMLLKRLNIPDRENSFAINVTFFLLTAVAMGRSRDVFFNDIPLTLSLIAANMVRIVGTHLILEITARRTGIGKDVRIPFALACFWKNSGLAMAMVAMLFPGEPSLIVPISVSMIFEQFYFMIMIRYYGSRLSGPKPGPEQTA